MNRELLEKESREQRTRMGLDDVLVAYVAVLPPMQVKEDTSSIVAANYHFSNVSRNCART